MMLNRFVEVTLPQQTGSLEAIQPSSGLRYDLERYSIKASVSCR